MATAMKFPPAFDAGNVAAVDVISPVPPSRSTCCTSVTPPVVGAVVTVHVKVWLEDSDPSDADAVTVKLPAELGAFPEIMPVVLLIDTPVGKPDAEYDSAVPLG